MFSPEYYEKIVVHVSVVSGCLLVAVMSRTKAVSLGADEFTAKAIFWIVFLLSVVLYAAWILILNDLFTVFIRRFKKKTKSVEPEEQVLKVNSFENIRQEQKNMQSEKERKFKELAILYAQMEFAPYTSDEQLNLLSQHVDDYLSGRQRESIRPIEVQRLTTLDICHFGWNIWNYARIGKQIDIAIFLKKVFSEVLKDSTVDSIKSHLKQDEFSGAIKIRENLFDQ